MSAIPRGPKAINYKKLEPHPLGSVFPPMGDDEYTQLKKSIKENGYDPKFPVILFEGKILDGNHRYTATQGIRSESPTFEEFKGTYEEAIAFVKARNLARRNLNPSQAAAVGAELVAMMEAQEAAEKEASKAAKAAGKPAKSSSRNKGGTKAAKAAAQTGVSERSVAAAVALKKKDPKKFQEVKEGKTKLNKAVVETEKKISEKTKKTDAFAEAKAEIEKQVGADYALIAEKNLSAKEVIKLSGLTVTEMKRVQPFIEAGWKLAAAMGYKSHNLQLVHPMRAFIDRATAQNGNFVWIGTHNKKEYKVTIEEVTA